MIKRRNVGPSFVDLLFIISLGFLLLLFVMLPFLNPISKDGVIEPPVQMIVEMTWDDESLSDMDLYMMGPNGVIVYYSNQDGGYMSLERDDLGMRNDTYKINGETRTVVRNYEIITLTDLPDGEYVVNVHHFSSHTGSELTNIRVTNIADFKVEYEGDVLVTPREEVTALTFLVVEGKVTSLRTDVQVGIRRARRSVGQ